MLRVTREKKRILIVDDDKLILDGFRQSLEQSGYAVDTAENGREAIEKSSSSFYSLALIDIRLPDMEGTELLTALRHDTPKMRKIIITGFPSLKNAVAAVNRDADAYLIKPILDMNQFLNVIKEQLKKQDEEQRYGDEKVAEYIESRMRDDKT